MKTALFLGAGASVCIRLPTAQELLRNLRQRHRDDEFITDVLKNEMFTDIEIVYDSVTDMMECVQSNSYRLLAEKLEYKLPNGKYVSSETAKNKLWNIKSSIRCLLLDSLKIEPADVREIEPIYERLEKFIREQGDDSLKIITTNYDLAIETYCDHVEREIVDGFVRTKYGYKGYWSGKWKSESDNPVYLCKLHGSINWHKEYEDETTLVKIGDAAHRASHYDILIMPTRTQKTKMYEHGLFSTIMNNFRNTLDEVDVLIIIGYSYRDNELNERIRERLGKGLAVISISPSSDKDAKKLGTAPFILERARLGEVSKRRKAPVYSYKSEFNQDTIDGICEVLSRVYSHLSALDSDATPGT